MLNVIKYESNEFIEIYRVWHEKVKNLTWKSKKPKNLTFQVFFKNLKNLGFLKWVSTALLLLHEAILFVVIEEMRYKRSSRSVTVSQRSLGSEFRVSIWRVRDLRFIKKVFKMSTYVEVSADSHFTIQNLPYGIFSTPDDVRQLLQFSRFQKIATILARNQNFDNRF